MFSVPACYVFSGTSSCGLKFDTFLVSALCSPTKVVTSPHQRVDRVKSKTNIE